MSKFSAVIPFLLWHLIFIPPASAEPGKTLQRRAPLTLNESIEIALGNRVEMRLEEERILAAQAKVNEAKGAFYPTVDFLLEQEKIKIFDRFAGVTIDGTFAGQPISVQVERDIPSYLISSELRGTFNIFAGGLYVARLAEASAEKKEAKNQHAITRDRLIIEVTTAYWELRKAQVVYDMASKTLELARAESRLAANRYQEKLISEIDLATVLLNTTEKEVETVQASQRLKVSEKKFNFILGEPGDPDKSASMVELADDPESLDIEKLFSFYRNETGPELSRHQAEIEAANAREKAARAELYPKVNVFSFYTMAGRDPGSLRASWADLQRRDWVIGMSLHWNLFSGFQSQQRIAKARSEVTASILRMEKKKRDLSDAIQEKASRVKVLEKELELNRKRLSLSQAQERIAKLHFEMQQSSQLQYDAAKLKVEEAAGKVIISNIDLVLAHAALLIASTW